MNRFLSAACVAALAAVLAGCAASAPISEEPLGPPGALSAMEYTRALDRARWEGLARAGDPAVRARAAVVAGRIGAPETIPLLVELLEDRDAPVRAATVFALGRIGGEVALAALREAAVRDLSPPVRAAAILELGRAGTAESPQVLLDLLGDGDPRIRESAALALGLLAYRKIPWEADPHGPLTVQLDDPSPGARWGAAYALMRSVLHGDGAHDLGLLPVLLHALEASDPRVRTAAARALGALDPSPRKGEGPAEEPVPCRVAGTLVRHFVDPEWRVAVEAIKAAGALADRGVESRCALEIGEALVEGTAHGNGHVRLAAIEALGAFPSGPTVDRLLTLAKGSGWRARASAARALGRLVGSEKEGSTVGVGCKESALSGKGWNALSTLARDPDPRVRAASASALGTGGARGGACLDSAFPILRALVEDPAPRVRTVAIEAICEAAGEAPAEAVASMVEESLVGALLTDDVAVLVTAADQLGKGGTSGAVSEIIEAYWRLDEPEDLEAMASLLTALGKIGGETAICFLRDESAKLTGSLEKTASAALAKARGETEGADPPIVAAPMRYREFLQEPLRAPPRETARVAMETDRGRIVMELFSESSPVTVANFLALAKAGYYDGLTFHRVVSGFVVQGGCPRGDGWGGPGYTIPCEVTAEPYERGSVGMALAGKDTGGSQFFITHSPQPHLDGRYTLFGRVVEGMAVVDAIQAGDRIVGIFEMDE